MPLGVVGVRDLGLMVAGWVLGTVSLAVFAVGVERRRERARQQMARELGPLLHDDDPPLLELGTLLRGDGNGVPRGRDSPSSTPTAVPAASPEPPTPPWAGRPMALIPGRGGAFREDRSMTGRYTKAPRDPSRDSAVVALIVVVLIGFFLALYAWAWQTPALDPAPAPAATSTP